MSDLTHIPLLPSHREGVDRSLVPAGELVRAENVRWNKPGKATKRAGSSAIATTAADGTNAPTAGMPQALGMLGDDRMLVSDGKVWVDSDGGWHSRGFVSSVTPNKAQTVTGLESSQVLHASVCYCNGYLVHVAETNSGGAMSVILQTTAGATVSQRPGLSGVPVVQITGRRGRLFAIGTTVYLVYGESSGTGIFLRTMDTTIADPTFGAESSSLGTLADTNAVFDVSPFVASSDWLLVYQDAIAGSGLSSFSLKQFTGTSLQHSDQFFPADSVRASGCCVSGLSGDKIWVATTAGGVTHGHVWLLTPAGASTAFTVSTGDPADGPYGACAVIRFDATHAIFFWSGLDVNVVSGNPWPRMYFGFAQFSSAGTNSGTTFRVNNLRPSSKPFFSNGELYLWTDNDNGDASAGLIASYVSGYLVQRTYQLFRFTDDGVFRNNQSPIYEMHAHPIQAASNVEGQTFDAANNSWLNDCVQTPDDWVFGCLDKVRSATAIDVKEMTNFVDVRFFERSQGLRQAWRQIETIDGIPHISGGRLTEVVDYAIENGFVFAPVIIDTQVTSGGSIDDGSHDVKIVFEYIDGRGRRHRSAPSTPASVTAGSSNNTLKISSVNMNVGKAFGLNVSGSAGGAGTYYSEVVAHLYRTLVSQQAYHRVTKNVLNSDEAKSASFFIQVVNSTPADAIAVQGEFLYTDGGVLANDQARAHRFMANMGDRLWLGGLFESRRVQCSKIIVPGEPVQFTENDAFFVDLPDDVMALQATDSGVLAWTADAIYLIRGDGPNDQGIGGFALSIIPSDVGCIDPRSIVETPGGWFFQSPRGIYRLPRGLSQPEFIGADVQETLLSYPIVQGAIAVAQSGGSGRLGETTVRIVVGDAETPTQNRVLVFDTILDRWISTDDYQITLGVPGIWDDVFAVTRASMSDSQPLRIEDYSVSGDNGIYVVTRLTTGDLRPFGYGGYGSVREIQLLLEDTGAAILSAHYPIDMLPTLVSTGVLLANASTLLSTGSGLRLYKGFRPDPDNCNSIQIDFFDGPAATGTVSAGPAFMGLVLQTNPTNGPKRLADRDRK